MKGVLKIKFFKAITEKYDYGTGNTTIKGELLTAKERESKFRNLPDDFFEKVDVNRNKTFWLFGVRFECKQ